MFKLFDDDQSGKITLKNLKRVAKELGETMTGACAAAAGAAGAAAAAATASRSDHGVEERPRIVGVRSVRPAALLRSRLLPIRR